MAILNYTTSIATEKTAVEIQKKLVAAGAQAFMSEYDENGVMCAMSFKINNLYFNLPIRIEGVYNTLQQDSKVPRRLKNYEQAARVAWRILKNWIEAQIAFIESEQAELEQLFFPYVQNQNGKTLYETIKENGFKQITSG